MAVTHLPRIHWPEGRQWQPFDFGHLSPLAPASVRARMIASRYSSCSPVRLGFGKCAALRFSKGVQRVRKCGRKQTKSVRIIGGKRRFVSSQLSKYNRGPTQIHTFVDESYFGIKIWFF